jgi:hypothetical protein
MSDLTHSEARAEASEVLRWILLFPAFGVLALLSANFTLGFFKWMIQIEGWLFWAMLPVGAIVILSNALAAFIACMIAPRKRSATILLAIVHFLAMVWGYSQYEWAELPTFMWGAHAVMVYLGLAAVYYLDRLNQQEDSREANEQPSTVRAES